jgi:hypothetical protein
MIFIVNLNIPNGDFPGVQCLETEVYTAFDATEQPVYVQCLRNPKSLMLASHCCNITIRSLGCRTMLKRAFLGVIEFCNMLEYNRQSSQFGECRMQTCQMFVIPFALPGNFNASLLNGYISLISIDVFWLQGSIITTAWHVFGLWMGKAIYKVSANTCTLNKQPIRISTRAWELGWS